MRLINFENYQLKVEPELLLIKPFRTLYNADRTKNKDTFMSQLSVVYFMADPRSTFNYITDPEDKLKAVIEQEGLPKNFKIDSKLEECINIYKKHTITTSFLLLQDMRVAVDKIRTFITSINLEEVDDKGRPKYQVSTIVSSLDKALALIPKIQEVEKIIQQELAESSKIRGSAEKALFEDGFKLSN